MTGDPGRDGRGQSSVVGVALLLGATVVALGVLTASVGTVIEGHAGRTDADRVARGFEEGLRPVETTGHRTATVRFTDGRLSTAERDLHVLRGGAVNGTVVANVPVGALVYDRGDRWVRRVAGAVVRGREDAAWGVAPPPVVGSESSGVLVVGAARLNASGAVGGEDVTATLETNVSHDRRSLGTGEFSVAIETTAPDALAPLLRDRGATAIDRRDVDGDGHASVVATFNGTRRGHLVVHDMRLEVTDG